MLTKNLNAKKESLVGLLSREFNDEQHVSWILINDWWAKDKRTYMLILKWYIAFGEQLDDDSGLNI